MQKKIQDLQRDLKHIPDHTFELGVKLRIPIIDVTAKEHISQKQYHLNGGQYTLRFYSFPGRGVKSFLIEYTK